MKRSTTQKGIIRSLLFIQKTNASQIVLTQYSRQAMSGHRFIARSINPSFLNRA
jgi:hypothetical protein